MSAIPFRRSLVVILPIFCVLALIGCGSSNKIVSVAVTPSSASIQPGGTQQFTAMATYHDGKTMDVSATATWNSATTSVATISATGLATGVASGTSAITATMDMVASPPATLTVASLVSIAVSPAAASVAAGATQQYKATGTFSDASTKDITATVTWSSATTAAATITSSGGLATGVAVGSSYITAKDPATGITSPATGALLTVTATGVNLQSISLTVAPLSATIPVGGTAVFTATGHFSDGSTQTLTNVTWGSATMATASITGTGVAQGLAAGTSDITAMSGAIASPATTLTVAAAAARAAYVAATGDGYTATYILNPNSASLVPVASGSFANLPVQVLPEPSGRFAYLLTGIGVVTASLDSTSGRITGLPSQILLTPNVASNQGVVDPTGQYMYVAGSTTTTTGLYSYRINLTDGSLTQIGTAIAGFTSLYAVIADRSGKYLYAIDDKVNKVFAYQIGAGGVLTPLTVASYPTGAVPQNPAIDPTNTYLYIPNQKDNSITAYTINGDGSLTAVTGQPFTAGLDAAPSFIAIDATGKFLYVTNTGDNDISALTIGAGGVLGAPVAGSPFNTGAGPFGIAIDPTNTSLAVANEFGNSISMFKLDSTTGVLTPAALPQVESPSGAFYISYGISTRTASVNPGIVYAANSVSGDISAFTSAAATGVLTPAAGSPLTGTTGNSLAATDLSGSLLLTGSGVGVQVGAFGINQTGGALTPLTSSPQSLAAGNTASSVFVAPTDDFAYVLDVTTGSVVQYPVSGGTLGTGASNLAFAGANNLAADPQGDFIYALGNNATNGIQQFTTYGGFALSSATTPLSGKWTSGAVDASGQFFVAVDSTAKTLQMFTITPAGTGIGTDGALTPLGPTVAVSGTGPWALVFDPQDRAVFVADKGAGTITPYAFSYATGQVGAAQTPTTALANGISNLSIEVTGTYLYAGENSSGAVGSKGAVAVYKIAANGLTLTAVAGSPFTTGTGNPGVAATNVVQ